MCLINTRKCALGAAVVLALGVNSAHSATTTGNNFTMLGATGLLTGGTNDVTFTWDGTLKTSVVTDGSSNASLSSPTPFFGKIWTAHHINVYGPGTYIFDTSCPAGNPAVGCPGGAGTNVYTLVVPSGYLGAHMLFDWSTSTNIDVVELWQLNTSWASTGTSPMNTTTSNAAGNTTSTVWSMVSIDTPASTISSTTSSADETNSYNGTKMIDGPFVGQSANFSVITGVVSFNLSDQDGVALSSLITSNTITVLGIAAPTTISVSGDASSRYSVNGGACTNTSGTVNNGDTVSVCHTSAGTISTPTDTTLTIAAENGFLGANDTFTSTTTGPDSVPADFAFTSRTDVALNTTITSNTIIVEGINTTATISVSSGSFYSLNGGSCTNTSGTVVLNDTVSVCHTSAATNSTTTTTTLTIGGKTGTFTSTTTAATVSNTVTMTADDPGKMPSGCSISAKPSSVIERGDWWLMAGFLVWLGALRMRFQRQA